MPAIVDGTIYLINRTYSATLEYPVSTSSYRLKLGYEYQNGLLKRVRDANGVPRRCSGRR